MNGITHRLLAAALLLLASLTQSVAADADRVLFTENFDGKLDPAWKWLREDPTGWKLENHALFVRTSEGSLWMKQNNNHNLLLRPLPAVPEGHVAVEVRVENEPTSGFEHAGVLLYYDDDNYAMLNRELVGGRTILQLVHEIDAKPKVGYAEKPWPDKAVWLRMEISAGKIRGFYRAGPEHEWQLLGECELPVKGDPRIALATGYAKPRDEHWSRFSDFRILQVTP